MSNALKDLEPFEPWAWLHIIMEICCILLYTEVRLYGVQLVYTIKYTRVSEGVKDMNTKYCHFRKEGCEKFIVF